MTYPFKAMDDQYARDFTDSAIRAIVSMMPEACRHALLGRLSVNASTKTRARLVHAGLWKRNLDGGYVTTYLGNCVIDEIIGC